MKGILLNLLGFVFLAICMAIHSNNIVVVALFCIACFLCISFGFYSTREALEETDSCLFKIILWANIAWSVAMLFAICGMLLQSCGVIS